MKIKTEKFEGPLDILLDLIEEKKLSINEVSLSDVVDQYLAYIKSLPELPMKDASDFLVVAATLMLIKSKSLLPSLDLTKEEEESIEDLERRLALLAQMRGLSRNIKLLAGRHNRLFARDCFLGVEMGFFPPENLVLGDIIEPLKALIATLPFTENLPEKRIAKAISLEEKMEELIKRVERGLHFDFLDIAAGNNRAEVIVSFLAMLELVRQGLVAVKQGRSFGSIQVSKCDLYVGTR